MSRLVDEYFELYKKYKGIYGDKIILLHQNGKFYEIYGTLISIDDLGNHIYDGSLQHISDHTTLRISKRQSQKYKGRQIYMAGPPADNPTCFQNLKRDLAELGFTIIVHFQDDDPNDPKVKDRSRYEIYTSAIQDISHDPMLQPRQNQIANQYIACISFYPHLQTTTRKQKINVGISFLSLLTNKSYVISIPVYTCDSGSGWANINTILQLYPPKEVILYKPNNMTLKDLGSKVHILKNTNNYVFDVCHEASHNIRYCSNLIREVYQTIPDHIPTLKQYETISSVYHSFAKLLEKVKRQCSRLLNNISHPQIIDTSKELFLGNDPLVQLNIISSGLFNDLSKSTSQRHKSVYHLLDYHKTPMGKRRFYMTITQPISDANILQQRLSSLRRFQEKLSVEEIRVLWKGLIGVNDIVMYHSKICKQKMSFESMMMYYKQIQKIHRVATKLKEFTDERGELKWFSYDDVNQYYQELHTAVSERFDMDTYQTQCPDEIRVQEGASINYDTAFHQINVLRDNLTCISTNLNTILRQRHKSAKVDLVDNDYFEITKTRYKQFLLPYIQKNREKTISLVNGSSIQLKDYEEVNLSKKNKIGLRYRFENDIDIKECERICTEEREILKRYISNTIQEMNNDKITSFVTKVDRLCNDIYLLTNLGYKLPTLDMESEKSFVDFDGVSHPIIQSLREYKTNSVRFDQEKRSMLLFGVNESGKSSLMKAIGMNIILAQCGLPVCCQSMRFFPYKKLYTRIQSQDNLWLSQSTYNVEIQELNNIVQGANDSTLVLADELCSGTEHTSAVKIVLATIKWLSDKNTHFLFTTHLHSLKENSMIRDCQGLEFYDIPIHYDEEKNEIVYSRKLVKGVGQELYGVMVARANHLPIDFMNLIDRTPINDIKQKQESKYNKEKRMDNCEVCGCTANERKLTIDHRLEQKEADRFGIIRDENGNQTIHKNHIDNLVCVCTFCHEKKTKGEISYHYEETNRGKILRVVNLKNETIPRCEENENINCEVVPEHQPEINIQQKLEEFVYRMRDYGEKAIADKFKKQYSAYKRPTIRKIRKIKENLC